MKRKIRAPFFEVGVKNYIYGDKVLEMARFLDSMSEKHDVDILYIVPYTEIRRVSESTRNLIVIAPYMDTLRPGRGIADVLPEAIKSAGAHGVLMNHCERPMTLSAIKKTIDRANELDLLSFACADTVVEAKALAILNPDIINPEPTDLIGSGNASDLSYVKEVIEAIKAMNPAILVEQAAGITRGQQVYDFIRAGSDGAGAGSGIFLSPDPRATADEMIGSVRRAIRDMGSQKLDNRQGVIR
jgi:triosephosphate isomerase